MDFIRCEVDAFPLSPYHNVQSEYYLIIQEAWDIKINVKDNKVELLIN